LFYTLAVVYIFWVVYTSICDNMWSKGTSSGWSVRCISYKGV